jgi:hypothetical protein
MVVCEHSDSPKRHAIGEIDTEGLSPMFVPVRPQDNNNSNMNHNSAPVAATTATRSRRGNRIATFFALLPILTLVGLGISAQAQRTIKQQVELAKYGSSSTDAARMAGEICSHLLGKTATPINVSTQTAYSKRRGITIREWNVICSTVDGQFLLRINAETGHVYAINRIGSTTSDPVSGVDFNMDEEASVLMGDESVHLSRREAEANARRYLTMLGVPSRGLEPVQNEMSNSLEGGLLWNFTFRTEGPDSDKRILKVSINGGSGGLEHVWNPSSLL